MHLHRSLPNAAPASRRKFAKALAGLTTGPLWHRLVAANPDASRRMQGPLVNLRDQFLIMRHADAPGFSDPESMRLDDCSSQRNLGEFGKRQAIDAGDWLRRQGIERAYVWSSPWCRCKDTAVLLGFGEPQIKDFLGSFFRDPAPSAAYTLALTYALKSWFAAGPSMPLLVVTHQVNISAYAGRSVASGEMLRIKATTKGQAQTVESIRM